MRSLVALAVLIPLADAHAKCAPSSLRAAVATPAGTAIPEGGGIVVVADAFFDGGKTATGDVTIQKGWRFKTGKLLVEPTLDVIAPGLVVYRAPVSNKLELVDGKRVVASFATTPDRPPVLDAPKVKEIISMTSSGRKSWSEVEVVLDGKPPATAVAIVAIDARGKAISFGRVDPKGKLVVYARKRCETVSPGTVQAKHAELVSVLWVDAMGRKSPASKPVKVQGGAIAVDE